MQQGKSVPVNPSADMTWLNSLSVVEQKFARFVEAGVFLPIALTSKRVQLHQLVSKLYNLFSHSLSDTCTLTDTTPFLLFNHLAHHGMYVSHPVV